MKRFFPIAVILMFGFFSCTDEKEEPAIEENTILEVMSVDNAIAEIQDLVNAPEGMTGGRLKENICATINYNQDTRMMTMDFGAGCTGPAGITRSGKIFVEYTGTAEEWFKHTITFENYQVQDLKIGGSITSNLVAETATGSLKLSRAVTNFTIKYADNTVLTLTNAQHTYEYALLQNKLLVTGESTGTTRAGIAFSSKIKNQVEYSIPCMSDQIFYPTSGIIELTLNGGTTYQLDFGTGGCDKEVVVSIDNFSKAITLK